jgi:hypothetical protein
LTIRSSPRSPKEGQEPRSRSQIRSRYVISALCQLLYTGPHSLYTPHVNAGRPSFHMALCDAWPPDFPRLQLMSQHSNNQRNLVLSEKGVAMLNRVGTLPIDTHTYNDKYVVVYDFSQVGKYIKSAPHDEPDLMEAGLTTHCENLQSQKSQRRSWKNSAMRSSPRVYTLK